MSDKTFETLDAFASHLITCRQEVGEEVHIILHNLDKASADEDVLTELNCGSIPFIREGEELHTLRDWLTKALQKAYELGQRASNAEAYRVTRRDTLFLVLDALINNDAAVKHATTVTDNPVQAAIDLLCKHNVKAFAEGKAAARDDLLHGLRREIELQKASLRDAEEARQRTEKHLHFLEATERYMQGLAGIEEGT